MQTTSTNGATVIPTTTADVDEPAVNLTSRAGRLQNVLHELEVSEATLKSSEENLAAAKVAYDMAQAQVEKNRMEAQKALSQIQSELQPVQPVALKPVAPPKRAGIKTLDTAQKAPRSTASPHGGKTRRDVIILLLAKESRPLRCAEIAKMIADDATKTYNTLATLKESAYVSQDNRRWQITERGIDCARRLEEIDQTTVRSIGDE